MFSFHLALYFFLFFFLLTLFSTPNVTFHIPHPHFSFPLPPSPSSDILCSHLMLLLLRHGGCIGCLLSTLSPLRNSYILSCIGLRYLQDLCFGFRNQRVKDQSSTFFYFPSMNFLKVGGGLGPIRVNNLPDISFPFQ